MWWLIGVVLMFFVVRSVWRTWAHPNSVLIRQAVNMGWLAAGVVTTDGYRNTKLFRDSMLCVVWFRDNNIELLSPPASRRFKDFVELEQWLATPKAQLLSDMAECMAEADKATPAVEDAPESPEMTYFQEVNDCIRMMGDRGDLALYAQLYPDFMAASVEVYKAGFECDVPARLVGGFIADAAASYQSNPSLGILCLEYTRNRIPQLWPGVREPAAQNLLAQSMDKEGKT